jgi:hypothetical protein
VWCHKHPATTPHAPFVLGHTCTVRHTHSKRSVCMSNPPRPVPSAVLCELQHGHFIAEVLVVAASVPQAKKEPEARSLRLYGDSLVLVRLLALIVLCVRPVRKGTLDAGPSECIGIRVRRRQDESGVLSPARSPSAAPCGLRAHPRATILAVSINFQKKAGGFFTPARSPVVVFLL